MGNSHHFSINRECILFIKSKLIKSNFAKLISAVKSGNLKMIKHFHSKSVNFNQTLRNGDTLIHIAVKSSRLGVVKFIAENVPQLDFNDRNLPGDTPLMIAIMNGDLKMVEYLVVKRSVDVNLPENRGFTPFIAACANGNIHMIDFLVKHGVNFKAKSKDGQTGLHRAAFYGHKEVIKYLIKDLKLNAMVPDKKGNLPLHLACMKLHFACVRLLVKASSMSVLELLHLQNNHGTKPIEILTRNLNKLINIDEVKHINQEQVEDYIRDKNNPPIIKREMSPTSMRSKSRGATTFERIRNVFTFRESSPVEFAFNQLDMTPNESAINIKQLEGGNGMERRGRDNTEEEILKFSRITNETISDISPVLPLLLLKNPSLGSVDVTPKTIQSQKSVRFSDAIAEKKERKPLRIITDVPRTSLKLNAAGPLSPDDLKSSGTFVPTMKSKFSSPIKVHQE